MRRLPVRVYLSLIKDEEIRVKALNNMNSNSSFVSNIQDAVTFFVWEDTKEGHSYWSDIALNLALNSTPLRKPVGIENTSVLITTIEEWNAVWDYYEYGSGVKGAQEIQHYKTPCLKIASQGWSNKEEAERSGRNIISYKEWLMAIGAEQPEQSKFKIGDIIDYPAIEAICRVGGGYINLSENKFLSKNSFNFSSRLGTPQEARLANKRQVKWLEACEREGKFIPEESIPTTPEVPPKTTVKPKFNIGDKVNTVTGESFINYYQYSNYKAFYSDIVDCGIKANSNPVKNEPISDRKWSDTNNRWWYKVGIGGNWKEEGGLELYKELVQYECISSEPFEVFTVGLIYNLNNEGYIIDDKNYPREIITVGGNTFNKQFKKVNKSKPINNKKDGKSKTIKANDSLDKQGGTRGERIEIKTQRSRDTIQSGLIGRGETVKRSRNNSVSSSNSIRKGNFSSGNRVESC
jgi:hypothetical protein